MSMSFRNLTASGDWSFGSGAGNYATGRTAIALNIRTRLLFFLNDCFFAMTFGVDWWNILGGKNPGAQKAAITQCQTIIKNSYGVTKINSVSAVVNPVTRRILIQYDIDDIFTKHSKGSVEVLSP